MSASRQIYKSAMWLLLLFITCSISGGKQYVTKTAPTIVDSINNFAIALHKTFPPEDNIIFSPWSIAFSLGMLLLGAEGKTFKELSDAMFLQRMDPDNIHYGFKQLREHLIRYGNDYEMNMFSTILVQEKHNISPVYKVKLQRYYDADIHDVDFMELGHLVTDWVNVWTSLKTGGKIQQIMSTVPSPDTIMLMLTANYFKGTWEETFQQNETKPATFRSADGKSSQIDMMFATRNMSLYSGEDLAVDAVDLPMKGDISFTFIKPENPADMGVLQKNLSADFFHKLFNGMSEEPVELGLPKFKAASRVELQHSLEMLGVEKLFLPNEAQLDGISSNGGLSVEEIIHKAALEVDEQGAVATSITIISIVARIKAYKLHFDRPFVFLLRDVKSGVILFMGRISKL